MPSIGNGILGNWEVSSNTKSLIKSKREFKFNQVTYKLNITAFVISILIFDVITIINSINISIANIIIVIYINIIINIIIIITINITARGGNTKWYYFHQSYIRKK